MTARRLTIVYIEDNAANMDLVVRVLEATGSYKVIGAYDGREGLATVERERPALLLVDLDVPVMNGFEVVRRVKRSTDETLARTPVVVVSANVLAHEKEHALELGCAAFIEKPFDINVFRKEIARILSP